jgi:hypothetical protein
VSEETCVLDPVEFSVNREELALDQLGLEVRAEGVDWGEAAIEAQMVRQAEGETSSNGHRAGVQIRIPLRVKAEGSVSLAQISLALQQKVGTIQDKGGWIRRDFDEEGGFAGSIGYKILRHTMAISGLDGWLFAHNQDAPDVVLTATRAPIGYSTEEREEGPFTSTAGARHLETVEPASPGSGPGLWRGRVKNNGTEDLRGLILSRECDFAPDDFEDPTAKLAYLATELTPKGGAEIAPVGAPEVRAVGAVASGEGAISPGLPAGTLKGDLLLMVAESGGAAAAGEANTPLTAAGWSSPPAPYASQKKGNTRLTVLYRIATGTDPTLTNDTGDHQIAKVIGIKAGTFDPISPFNGAGVGTQAATKAVSIPGVTTTRDKCLVVACASGNLPDAAGTTEFSGVTNAALTGLTERIDNTTSAGDGGAIFAATGVKEAKGAASTTTVTAVTESERGLVSLAVNPASYVQHTSLTAGWLTILGSEVVGKGHMTHRGPRVMLLRVDQPSGEVGDVLLQLQARALGAAAWDDSFPVVSAPVVGGWMPLKLGVARPEEAVLGDQRWEWQLLAKAQSGAGAIRIRDVYPLSTEQCCVLSESYDPPAADVQATKSPTAVADDSRIGTKAWTNPENAKAEDGLKAKCTLEPGQVSHYLAPSFPSFGVPSDATVTGILVQPYGLSVGSGIHWYSVYLTIGGELVGENQASQFVWGVEAGNPGLWGASVAPADCNGNLGMVLAVNSTASTTASIELDRFAMIVYWAEEAAEDRVCFATRSLELRSDGVYRQHRTDDVWGRLVPDGFYPTLPAGGIEGRPTRSILIPSAGDFEALPDGATPALEEHTYSRDGFHFAREAAG